MCAKYKVPCIVILIFYNYVATECYIVDILLDTTSMARFLTDHDLIVYI